LLRLIQPYLKEISDIETREIREKIDHAASAHKICFGIQDVWHNMMGHKGGGLIVERNFSYPRKNLLGGNQTSITEPTALEFENDAVDVLIEKALISGGVVKFVDQGVIPDDQHIALFTYY